MRIDPYLLKRLPKWHHKRVLYTAYARIQERFSCYFFEEYAVPFAILPELPPTPDIRFVDTQVEPEQARYLLQVLRNTEKVPGCVVEIGSWKGETTSLFASNTEKKVVAIDPWLGDSNGVNYRAFCDRTETIVNLAVERKPFGEAARTWAHGPASFVFVDAAHDYVNVAHDIAAVRSMLAPHGVMAMHDTDRISFAGCRRAVYEVMEQFELVAHIPNLTILKSKT